MWTPSCSFMHSINFSMKLLVYGIERLVSAKTANNDDSYLGMCEKTRGEAHLHSEK